MAEYEEGEGEAGEAEREDIIMHGHMDNLMTTKLGNALIQKKKGSINTISNQMRRKKKRNTFKSTS